MILYRKLNPCIERPHAKTSYQKGKYQKAVPILFMPKALQSNLGLTELEGDRLHKQIKRIRNDVAKCNPFSAHLFSSLSSCWRGKHPSAVQLLLNTCLYKSIPAPTPVQSYQPSKTPFHAQGSLCTQKKSPKSGAGRGKHPLPRPRSCCRKGWLLGKVSAYPASTGFDGLHFIAVCFYSLATKGALGSQLSSGQIPLLMVPRYQP